jgi:hypothetical protein
VESAKEVKSELAMNLPMLESEVRVLRQLLSEVKSNLEELRRDRHAERAAAIRAGAEQRAWFCGRASTGN